MKPPVLRFLGEGGRKFVVVLYAITWAGVLALLDRLTTEFATVVSIGVTAFAAANAFVHHVHRNGHDQAPISEPQRQAGRNEA